MTSILLSIEAHQKTGKTTLAYTAPLPIVGFGFDLGTERAIYGTQFGAHFQGLDIQINKYTGKDTKGMVGNDITVWELPKPIQLDSDLLAGYEELWDFFQAKYVEAIYKSPARSIVIDTSTLCRRTKADSYLQELQRRDTKNPRKQLLQIEWGVANKAMRELTDAAKGAGKNLILTNHLADDYKEFINDQGKKDSYKTGLFKLEGWSDTYQETDVAIGIGKDERSKLLTATIINCGFNLELEGRAIENPTWDRIVGMISMSLEDRVKFEMRNGN